jgi:hypothetical protein
MVRIAKNSCNVASAGLRRAYDSRGRRHRRCDVGGSGRRRDIRGTGRSRGFNDAARKAQQRRCKQEGVTHRCLLNLVHDQIMGSILSRNWCVQARFCDCSHVPVTRESVTNYLMQCSAARIFVCSVMAAQARYPRLALLPPAKMWGAEASSALPMLRRTCRIAGSRSAATDPPGPARRPSHAGWFPFEPSRPAARSGHRRD